jgi:hypothetical protein
VPSAVFGQQVKLSDSGYRLATGFRTEQGVYGVALYKESNGVWQNVRTITVKTSNETCEYRGFSRDGSTVAQVCSVPQSSGGPRYFIRTWSGSNWTVSTDIPLESPGTSPYGYTSYSLGMSADGSTIAAHISPTEPLTPENEVSQVNVYKRANGVYSQVATLRPGAWAEASSRRDSFGVAVAVSGDGATIAVGDYTDSGKGTGPRAAPLLPGAAKEGGVYVYRLTSSWKLANMVKPNYLTGTDRQSFGRVLALSNTGRTLLAGDPYDSNGTDGIGSDWRNAGVPGTGAVWMY